MKKGSEGGSRGGNRGIAGEITEGHKRNQDRPGTTITMADGGDGNLRDRLRTEKRH